MTEEQKTKENLAVAGAVGKRLAKGISKFLLKAVLAIILATVGSVIGFLGSGGRVGSGAQLIFFCAGGWAGWALGAWLIDRFSKKPDGTPPAHD